jgi:hypothetical protein
MLKEIEIEKLFAELSLPEAGRKLIRFARMHGPVKEANSRLGNCIVWHYSKKMGYKHLELESRTVEGAAATTYEDEYACLEFWPQQRMQAEELIDQLQTKGITLTKRNFLAACEHSLYPNNRFRIILDAALADRGLPILGKIH